MAMGDPGNDWLVVPEGAAREEVAPPAVRAPVTGVG